MIAVKSKRLEMKMTQQELASRSGVPQSLIADIENGKRLNPTINTAFKLSRVLGCTVEELIVEEKAE